VAATQYWVAIARRRVPMVSRTMRVISPNSRMAIPAPSTRFFGGESYRSADDGEAAE
jgi:hypothetical protein